MDRLQRRQQISEVFRVWLEVTGRHHTVVLTERRSALIGAGLDTYGLADCRDVVSGWRWSSWHNGDKDGQVRNSLEVLFRDPESIEELRDLEHRYRSGNVAGPRRAGAATVADIQAAQRARGAA